MRPILRILEEVPSELFLDLNHEISKVDWRNLPVPDVRARHSAFKTCQTISLRIHSVPRGTPQTVEALSSFVDCEDTPLRAKFPATEAVVRWISESLPAERVGRIMLVNLNAGGDIRPHIDPGVYFQAHYRLHIPIVTNAEVMFFGGQGTVESHMPTGTLCQLFNLNLHGVRNASLKDRIHLIVDIATFNPRLRYEVLPESVAS